MDTVKIELPVAFIDRLKQYASWKWSDEEADGMYESTVSGNADDAYTDGVNQGASEVAEEILQFLSK